MRKINLLIIILFLVSCEGEQGEIGPMGSISLINIENELPSDNCSSGGFKIESGIDINDNGILDLDEVQSTQYICNGDGAKELRFDFNMSSSIYWTTTTSFMYDEFNGIPDFNINNFQGVDSIIFGAYLQSSNTNTNCTLEIYDFTNGTVIANSSISTNSSDYIWVTTSQNLIDQFPNEAIDLRLRMSSDNGATVSCRVPRLILLWE